MPYLNNNWKNLINFAWCSVQNTFLDNYSVRTLTTFSARRAVIVLKPQAEAWGEDVDSVASERLFVIVKYIDMKKLLLIVDPQIDFITGTLPVPGAEKAMNNLAAYVSGHSKDYALICVTCDRHPLRHSSFTDFGGLWPVHCVESSVGGAIWPPIMEALLQCSEKVHILYKGEDLQKDEYSIFQSEEGAVKMDKYLKEHDITDIDICGLAGDICVANTLRDAQHLYPNLHFHILHSYIASLK